MTGSAAVSDAHSKPYLAAVVRRKQVSVTGEDIPRKPSFSIHFTFIPPNPWLFPQAIIFHSKLSFPFL